MTVAGIILILAVCLGFGIYEILRMSSNAQQTYYDALGKEIEDTLKLTPTEERFARISNILNLMANHYKSGTEREANLIEEVKWVYGPYYEKYFDAIDIR